MVEVSIVLATYNGKKFIEEQLDSLCNQTRLPDEVLICDDKSQDGTAEMIKKYIICNKLDSYWTIKENEVNKGYAKNFIDLALSAKGEYIFFCDQDDIWDCNKIEKMTEILDENEEIDLLCSNLEPFYYGDGGRKWDKRELEVMTNNGSIDKPSLNYFNFFCRRSGCTMCVRKSFLHKISSYWIPGWAHDDFVWKMSVIEGKCAIYQYCSLRRRMHDNNASSMKVRTREWRLKQVEEQLEQYISFYRYSVDINAKKSGIKIIKRNKECANKRIQLLNSRNPFLWVNIYLKYRDCYPRKKAVMLDLYLTIFPQYKGVN